MKSRVFLILLAVVLGLIAAVGIFSYVRVIGTKAEEEAAKVKVVVAKRSLSKDSLAKDLIAKGLLEEKEVPKKYVAEKAVSDTDQLKGKVLLTDVSKGQQITRDMFSTPEKAGIAFEIPDGLRAISIQVSGVTGVSGRIKSGSKVDLIASFREGPGDKRISKTILQNVLVLEGVSFRTEKTEEKKGALSSKEGEKPSEVYQKGTVVLALSLKDAEKLVFAAVFGVEGEEVWVVLRPSKEEETVKTPGQTIESVVK